MGKKKADAAIDRPQAEGAPPQEAPPAASAANDTVFDELLALVHRDTGMDVTQYREATLRRRVERRRRLLNLPSDDAYLGYLRGHPDEVQALQRSFLISVTSFFRDAPAFAALRAALRRLVDEKPVDQPLRVWVPACATGEEAYSVAIVLLEALAGRTRRPEIKIFATDLDAAAIAVAKLGCYDASELEGLDPDLQARYFRPAGGHHEVAPEVRDLCLFAQHDVVRDVPFTRLDLVSCRNLLIYFKPALQTEILRRFQYALHPGGLLLLGRAESLTEETAPLFDPVEPYQRLFRRRPGPSSPLLRRGALPAPHVPALSVTVPDDRPALEPPLQQAMRDALLSWYAPASVLFDPVSLAPLHFHGANDRYLLFPQGSASFDLPSLLPEPLRGEFLALAAQLRDPVCGEASSLAVPLQRAGGTPVLVRLRLRRLSDAAGGAAPWMLSFEDLPQPVPAHGSAAAHELSRLRHELDHSRVQSRALVQALQASNRELQLSAEELQTSNEELHAANEELSTVNDELQAKSEELARLNETLSNIQDSIHIGLVVVDQHTRVLRYNELAVRVFGLLPGDIGRPLDEVPRLLDLPRLQADVAEVVRSGRPLVRRAVRDDFHYVVQIAPYVSRRGERVGAVLSFSDVSELRAAELAQQRAEQRFRLITEALTEVVWMSTPGLRQLLYLSPAFEALWGLPVAQALEQPLRLLDPLGPADRQSLLERLSADDALPWAAEFPLQRADGLQRWVHVQGRGVLDDEGRLLYQVCTAVDMTERVRSEQSVRDSERQFRELAHSLPVLVFTADARGRCDFVNEQWLRYTGGDAAQPLGDGWVQQVHPLDQLRVTASWQEAVIHGGPYQQEFRLRGRDGEYRWFDTRALPHRGTDGRVLRWFGTHTDIDDRKQAEARLQRNVQLIHLVMDSVPALVSYLDDQGIYRWVNRHYSEWFLVDRQAIVGRAFREVVGDVIYQEAGPLLQRALQGETVSSTRRAKRPHWSDVRWIHITYTPDRAEDGRVRGVVTTVRDITAEREATQALQASEARANSIIETAPQAMLIADGHGMIERANQRAQLLFAPDGQPIVGLPATRLLPDWPQLQHTQAGHDSGPAATRTSVAVRADGSTFPAEVGLGQLQAGSTRTLIVTVQDVSLQVEAQRVLTEHQGELERLVNERTGAAQQAEAQMRLILESTADGLYGVDAQGQITFVNVMASTLLGYAADAMTHRPARELLLPLQPDGTPAPFEDSPLAHTLRTGEPQRVEHALFRRRDGSTMPVVYAVRAMWRRGQIVGAVVSFSDISERLAAEAAREAALTEAERLARVRTEFLTNMSHEIRTPLNAVLGLAEVAARGDRDRAPEETFRMILDSGQVLLGVVNDILDFSKIEAGKLRTESQPFDLGPVIDRAVALVAPRIFAKGLRFSIDEAPDLPCRLRGDALRLTQVLGNLLSNAQKFTEHGGVELRAWCDLHDLWFTVTDSGIGIEPGQMKRLFTPFEQADSSTTRRFGGSGLGLVISRYLMELMGGSIAVRSQPGVGSTFTVRLPMIEPETPPLLQRRGRIVLTELGEIDHVPEALHHRGFEVVSVSTLVALRQKASLVVIDIDALADERLRDAAVDAVRHGQRLALMTHPMAAELPPDLRGHVVLLEQPLRARHVAGALTQPERQHEPPNTGGRLAGMRVLAAEDNEVNALVLEAIMRIEDAQLTLVDNGERAVEQVRKRGAGGFDLVLTDIQMPVMDGYDATREMLALDPALPVIGLTAHAMPEERERCLSAGMVDHLPKPIEVEQLVGAVLRHARRPSP